MTAVDRDEFLEVGANSEQFTTSGIRSQATDRLNDKKFIANAKDVRALLIPT